MKLKICFFLILCYPLLFAQKITGTITKKDNNPIENATVSVWSSSNKETLLSYVYTNEKGFYAINLDAEKNTVFIEVSCLDYETKSSTVSVGISSQKVDFVLDFREIELKEVIIKDEKAIRVKNDTTFYDPKKFLNGSEIKVEDLLKKLPGMTVNAATGEIKYKGKSIETVKLEDDDLFGGNYAIGTKNISVDMVEQVQAIENYSDNPLLKGIADSDKVAINLKLKKQKIAYSGSSSIKNGIGDKILFEDDVTLLGISKKISSFGIVGFNNFGGGLIDVNSFSVGFNSSEIQENNFYSKKLLSEPGENSSLPDYRTKFNNSVLANYNFVNKLSKKISIKNNILYFYNDSFAFENFKNNFFLNNNTNFETSQENYFNKRANSFKAETKLTFKLNTKSLLITSLSFSKQKLSSDLNSTQNKTLFFQNNLQTEDFFFKAKTNYTLKLGHKKALQIFSEFSKNEIPQQLFISPNNNLISNQQAANSVQNSNLSKKVFNNKIIYLENKDFMQQTFSLGFMVESSPLSTRLIENDYLVTGFLNDVTVDKSNFFWEYNATFKYNKFKIQPYISGNFYSQNLNDLNSKYVTKKTDLVYNGNILLTYKVNKFSSFFVNANFDNKTPDQEFLYANKVLEDNKSLKKNVVSFDFLKSQSVNLGYNYYNLNKQFGVELKLQLQNNQNTFISNISVNPNYTLINYFQNPVNIENKNGALIFDKQFRSLRLYLKQTAAFSIKNYKNTLENFILRDNISKTVNSTTLLFSNFNFPVNFENTLNFSLVNFETNNDFSNQRISLNNVFKLIANPIKKWVFTVSQDYFVTDTKTNNHFNFYDFDIKYKSQKFKWLTINFTGKNLTNIKTFSETYNSDYSRTIYTSNLLPRNFLIGTNFNF